MDARTIDRVNILQASLSAMAGAAAALPPGSFAYALVDGKHTPEVRSCWVPCSD